MRVLKKQWRTAGLFCLASSLAILGALPAQGQAASQQSDVQRIDIAAGPMDQSFLALGDALGVNIIAPQSLVSGKTAPAVSGVMTADDALAGLLAGSGLSATRNANGDYIVATTPPARPQQPISPTEIPEVTDEPDIETIEPPLITDTIIVRGTKRDLTLQDTQTSVAVLTEEQLDERVIFELEDILLRTPNVSTNSPDLFNFSIRGIGSGGVRGNANFGRTSNVYIDGAPITARGSLGALNLWDVGQVEVLRGPQSTIQGRNALAGALVVQTSDPEYEFGARVRGLIAEDNTYQASAMITGPIVSDQIAFRLAADYREQDFNVLNANTGARGGDNEATTIRAKLLVEPEALSGLRLELGLQYTDLFSTGGNRLFVIPPEGSPEAEGFDLFDRIDRRQDDGATDHESVRYFADIQYQFAPQWRLVTLLTYDDTDEVSQNLGEEDPDVIRMDEVFAIDSRIQFDYGNVRGWFGGYYYDDSVNTSFNLRTDLNFLGVPTDPPGAIISTVSDQAIKTENYAIYGDVTFDLTDSLIFNLGARYDWESITDTGIVGTASVNFDPCIVFLPGSPEPLTCLALGQPGDPETSASDYEAFLPRGSLVYRFDEDRSVAFSIARGYRAGGFNAIGLNPGSDFLPEFEPEFLTNYELAVRSQWFDRRLTANANIFYARYDDIQILRPTFLELTSEVINAAESEMYGAEFSLDYQVTEHFNVFADLGVLETEFIDFPFAVDGADTRNPLPGDPGFANLAGNEFAQAPGVSGALGATYDNGNLFGSIIVNYSDDSFSDFTNLDANRTNSYVLTNARLGYRYGKARLSLFADNIFEEEFISRIGNEEVSISGGQVSVIRPPFNQGFISPPRTIGLELDVEF